MSRPSSKPNQQPQHGENVEGAWLLKALAAVFIAAIVCTYLTVCFLFYRNQWQVVLHPIRTSTQELAQNDLIRFAPGDSGQPQLSGRWLAANGSSRYGGPTVLFLRGGDGTQAAFTQTLAALQGLGINVFTFDYRGYGESANISPNYQRMTEDSEAAWSYLTKTRGLLGSSILPYGVGVGASLATNLAAAHPEIPGVILDSPYGDLRNLIRQDSRFRLLPIGLLFHEDFPLAVPLSSLQKPKLLLNHDRGIAPEAFRSAAEPKIMVSLPTSSGPLFTQAVSRFLDQYVSVPSRALEDTKAH